MRDAISIGKLIDLSQYGIETTPKMDVVHISDLDGKTIVI